jgi:hypothetical protein
MRHDGDESVFADKGDDDKIKQHTRWLTSSPIGARVKGEH